MAASLKAAVLPELGSWPLAWPLITEQHHAAHCSTVPKPLFWCTRRNSGIVFWNVGLVLAAPSDDTHHASTFSVGVAPLKLEVPVLMSEKQSTCSSHSLQTSLHLWLRPTSCPARGHGAGPDASVSYSNRRPQHRIAALPALSVCRCLHRGGRWKRHNYQARPRGHVTHPAPSLLSWHLWQRVWPLTSQLEMSHRWYVERRGFPGQQAQLSNG